MSTSVHPATRPIKSARHHWWPQSLSQFWADSDGCANQLSWNGELVRSSPGQFGAIKNAHHIRYGDDGPTPWDETFEPVFDGADGKFPAIVDWLLTLDAPAKATSALLAERLHPQPAPDETLADLIACVISLIVRSPRFRGSIRSGVGSLRTESGIANPEVDDSLVGVNMKYCQQLFTGRLAGHGKFAALYTDCGEFIFGDGFFHNFSSTTTLPLSPRCLVPLTPTMCILYTRPMRFPSNPRLVTIRLRPDEVRLLNNTVQLYSGEAVFFRNERPEIIAEFACRQFRQFKSHHEAWIDELMTAVAPEA